MCVSKDRFDADCEIRCILLKDVLVEEDPG
jgi:hypothetical protein